MCDSGMQHSSRTSDTTYAGSGSENCWDTADGPRSSRWAGVANKRAPVPSRRSAAFDAHAHGHAMLHISGWANERVMGLTRRLRAGRPPPSSQRGRGNACDQPDSALRQIACSAVIILPRAPDPSGQDEIERDAARSRTGR